MKRRYRPNSNVRQIVAERRCRALEADNARLRQQLGAANAQLDFILENIKCDTPSEQNVSSQD